MLRSEVTGQRPRAPPTTETISVAEKVIRELAYELWEQAGRPDGRSEEFWFAARYEVERREETGEAQVRAPVRLRADPSREQLVVDRRLAA